MRLRARDHHISSTFIGGKGGAGPCSFHTTPEGPTEYVSECKMDVKVYINSYVASNGSCFMGDLNYFQRPPLGGRPNTKSGDHDTPNAHNR